MDSEATVADFAGSAGAPLPIGAVLAAARADRGLDLADIARDTRVPVRHLAAIEADDHDGLPALPYAIGFVKAFARAVGVDPEMAGARFRGETTKAAHVPLPAAMAPIDARRLPPRGVVAASLVALIAVVAGVVAWSSGAFDEAPSPAPVAVATASAPAAPPATAPDATTGAATAGADAPVTSAVVATTPAAPATAPPGSTAPVVPAPTTAAPAALAAAPRAAAPGAGLAPAARPVAGAGGPVVITASEDAWFKVSVYDATVGKVVTVKTGVLAKGERYAPPPTPGLRLWTGRAGALTITVDGRAIPPLGGPVETVKNVSLDPGDLRARLTGATPAPGPLPGRAGPPVG